MTPREELIDWIEDITEWSTKLDMTFEWNCDEFTARRIFTSWMGKQLPGSTYLFSVERDPLQHKVANTRQGINQACHVHAISDTNWPILQQKKGETRKYHWENWFKRYGRCRIEPVKNVTEATGYALKKVLNYSEARSDSSSHMRKTDVDWGLEFGKGKHAARKKDMASRNGQTYFSKI